MDVYIIGCGGNAKVVVDICNLCKFNIIGFFDDKYDGSETIIYHKYKIIGNINNISKYNNINLINSIGDCKIRHQIFDKLKDFNLNWINCIHPNSYISPTSIIGYGNIICYGSFINSDSIIGNFNLINTYAIIEHDCEVGNFNHFAPKTTLCGGVNVGNYNLFGAGTTIIPGKKIGNSNIIGAMTCIIKDVENFGKIVGIPGKNIHIV